MTPWKHCGSSSPSRQAGLACDGAAFGLGCPLAQGFLWSRAVPAEQVLTLYAAFNRQPMDALLDR